jgi:WD40 repeat protein
MSRLLLISSLLLVLALPAWSEPQPAEIERLIKQLGSDSFAEREAASKALKDIGEPALDALRKATKVNDLEVRLRAELLVEAVESRLYHQLNCFRGHAGSVFSVAFSPDGKQLLSGSHDRTIRLWDVQSGKELRRFESHRDLVYGVAFSPDGRRILSGSADNTVRLCDVKTGNELRCFKSHTSIVYAVAFRPDGKRVASAGHDKTVRLWDVETGKELHRFEGHPYYAFNGVTFSPDGKRVVAGSSDATVRLWDVESGEELRCFRGHGAAVHAVAFSADGKWILSGSGPPRGECVTQR